MSDIQFNPLSPQFQGAGFPSTISYADALNYIIAHQRANLLESMVQELQQVRQQKTWKGTLNTATLITMRKELEKLQLPKGATASEIKTLVLFKAMQPSIATELTYISNLVNLLKSANPELAQALGPKLSQLQQIMKSYPHISKSDLAFAKALLDTCGTQFLGQMPVTLQSQFLKMQAEMYLKMAKESTDAFVALKEMGEETATQQKSLEKIQELLQQLRSLLPSDGKSLDPAKLQQILAILSSLVQEYKKVPLAQRAEIERAIRALLKMKGANKTTLGQILGETLIEEWMQELLDEDPSISSDQMRQALQEKVDDEGDDLPQALTEELYSQIGDLTLSEEPTIERQKGKVTLHPTQVAQLFTVNGTESKKVAATLQIVESSVSTAALEHTTLQQGYSQAVALLASPPEAVAGSVPAPGSKSSGATTPPNSTSSGGSTKTSTKDAASTSDQNEFANVVIHTVLPNEMTQLEKYDLLLFFANFAANFGNQILSKITDFSSAASIYNWGGTITGNPPNSCTGSAAQAEAKLVKEFDASQQDQAELTNTQTTLNNEINTLTSPPTGSPEARFSQDQRNQMIADLQPILANVKAALTQVTAVLNCLEGMQCIAVTSTTYQITGFSGQWTDYSATLNNAESAVVNGVTSGPTTTQGGLLQVSSQMGSFVTKYSDQGSQNQEELQIVMSEFQQLMSILSASLQTWNQCYNTPAQAIGR